MKDYKYKVVIIDDEQLAINILKNYLSKFSDFELIETFNDPLDALSFIASNKIDLVFSDIAMPNLTGVNLAKQVKNQVDIILVTAYSEFAIESFEIDVLDYVLKPLSFERFSLSINRFLKKRNQNIKNPNDAFRDNKSFFVKDGDEYIKILVDDIEYIEGMKDYSKISCGKNYYMVLKSLKHLEEVLKQFLFIRIHKSFIVPINKIIQFNGRSVIVNKKSLPVGLTYKNNLKKILQTHQLL